MFGLFWCLGSVRCAVVDFKVKYRFMLNTGKWLSLYMCTCTHTHMYEFMYGKKKQHTEGGEKLPLQNSPLWQHNNQLKIILRKQQT